MREIITVTGKCLPEEVGFCQFHEHIMVSKGRSYEVNPAICMEDPDKSMQEVLAFQKAGGASIIDAQPGGCSRMAAGLARISEETGVKIICSTGFHKLIFYPETHWIRQAEEEELSAYYKKELTEGVTDESDSRHPADCDCLPIRAGIVKCALDEEGLSPRYRRLFAAAADAARECEKTMLIHVEKGADPKELLTYLLDQGIPAGQMVFCHMDRTADAPGMHEEILRAGAYLEFDTIGRFKYHSDEEEIRIFQRLLDAGFEKQLLFSLDTTRARMKAYDPAGIGLDYILRVFIPKMLSAGITKEQIRLISEENAVRALVG